MRKEKEQVLNAEKVNREKQIVTDDKSGGETQVVDDGHVDQAEETEEEKNMRLHESKTLRLTQKNANY